MNNLLFQNQLNMPPSSSVIQEPFTPFFTPGPITFLPKLDIIETPEDMIFVFEVPGAEPETVEVEISNHELTITGPSESFTGDNAYFHYQERLKGRYMRTVPLPLQVDTDRAVANFRNGILLIRFPKGQDLKKAKKVTIGKGKEKAM